MTNTLGRFGLGISNCRPTASVVNDILAAEERGAEIAFVSEDINCRDAFQIAALAALRTSRIRLATGVVNPYTRNPTALAMSIATLDEISHGRASLGLGSSSPSLIADQMGIPPGRSAQVLREATSIIRGLLAGESVTYRGERFTYHAAELEVQPVQPHIPIIFAAMGPLTLRLAGEIADGVLLNVGASLEYVHWAIDHIMRGAESVGRSRSDITVAAWFSTYVGSDRTASLTRARSWMATMLSIPRQGELLLAPAGFDTSILVPIRERFQAYPHRGDLAAAARFVPDDVVERLTLIGTPHEVLSRLAGYRSAGVDLPVLSSAAIQKLTDSVL